MTRFAAVGDVEVLKGERIALAPLAKSWRELTPVRLGKGPTGGVVEADQMEPWNILELS